MMHRLRNPLLLTALLLGLLFGCAQSPERKAPEYSQAQSQQLAAAAASEASGDFTAAATSYERLAATATSPQRDEWLLRAAGAWLKSGDVDRAEGVLGQVQRRLLPISGQLLGRLIEAEIHLARNRAGLALELLETPPYPDAPTDLKVRYLRDRAQGLRLSGDLLGSAQELSELDLLVVKRTERLQNQLEILRTLVALPDSTLERMRPTTTGLLAGWMDLARILKVYQQSPEAAAPLLDQWYESHPSHPALPDLFQQYLAADRAHLTFARVAVLLPSSGRYAGAGDAIRDGLLAAYYASPAQQRPQLRFYDSSNPAYIQALLQQAIAEGAEAVIGPLQKESVQQLAQAGALQIPVLTLNQVPGYASFPANLFQFGLAPEDEAAQAADKARADGVATAMALVPQGEWGERLLQSFVGRWESLGGQLGGYQTYDPEQNDFTPSINALLRQHPGVAARENSASNLRRAAPGSMQPDSVALFLAANWTKARQLWPQVRFHTAVDIPAYTTSHVYTGRFSYPEDLDLVGLEFPDIPWILTPETVGTLTPAQLPPELGGYGGALARLFALGMDSYRLLAYLQRMRDIPSTHLAGATGDLYLDRLNRVHRRLVWARMTASGPQVLGLTPDPDRVLMPTRESAEPMPAAATQPSLDAAHGQTR